MIEITRSLARQLRAVFRRAARKSRNLQVALHTDGQGLRARVHRGDVLVEYHQPGAHPAETIVLPLEALADFEAKSQTPVALEHADQAIQAQWNEGVVPQVKGYDAGDPEKLSTYPDLPQEMTGNDPGLLKALADASASAAREDARYAIQNIQIRGSSGTLVATEGHELLLQNGFHFPWTEDLLIPAVPAYACRELLQEGPVRIGKSATHVSLQTGPWTLHLPIDTQGRFPKAEQVIPSLNGKVTRWTIDPEDASFLAKALPRLPGEEPTSPVTVDLNGEVVIRARAGQQGRTTDVVLARSQVRDGAARFSVPRRLLARALDLGFHEVSIVSSDAPMVCRDEKRTLVLMTLGKVSALRATDDAIRITSVAGEPARAVPSPESKATEDAIRIASVAGEPAKVVPSPERRKSSVSKSSDPRPATENGTSHAKANGALHQTKDRVGFSTLIAEADALKALLRDTFNRSKQLIAAIRRHKKQAHAVQATLASLRQLQHIDG